MNIKAAGYLLIYLVMILYTLLFNQWLLHRAYNSAGVSSKEVIEKGKSLSGGIERIQSIVLWLLKLSPSPRRTWTWLLCYVFAAAPAVLFFLLSVIGLFSPALNGILDVGAFIVIIFYVGLVVYQLLNKDDE